MAEPISAAHVRFGARLRAIRTARGWSMERLGALATGGPIGRRTLSKIELGKGHPSERIVRLYARHLGGNATDLTREYRELPEFRVMVRKEEVEAASAQQAERGYRIWARTRRYVIDGKYWRWMHMTCAVELTRADQLQPMLLYLRSRTDYRLEVFQVRALAGCRIGEKRLVSGNQIAVDVIILPPRPGPGVRHVLALSVLVDTEEKLNLSTTSNVHYSKVGPQVVEIEFLDSPPETAWRFEAASSMEATMMPSDQSQLLTTGPLVAEYFEPIPRETYGISWSGGCLESLVDDSCSIHN